MTSFSPSSRRYAAAAALACLTALVTACGSSSNPPASPAAAGTSAPTTPATTAAPSGTAASTATSPPATPPPGPASCATRDLGVSTGLSQGAAGSTFQVIDFKNIGAGSCTVFGYPGVSFVGGSPVSQIGRPASRNHTVQSKVITLLPRQVANVVLQIVVAANYPAARCHPVTATHLRIYPPNQTTPMYLGYKAQACAKPVHVLSVTAMQPGSGGNG